MIRKFWPTAAKIAALVVVLQFGHAEPARGDGPAEVSLDQALNAPPDLLATGYLAVKINLMVANLVRNGGTIHTNIDGKPTTIDKSNAATYIDGFEKRLGTYGTAIEQRGFQSIDGKYKARKTSGCTQLALSQRSTVIEQDGFEVKLTQRGVTHRGVTVESALVVEHAANPQVHLVGRVDKGRIELAYAPTNCVLTLTRAR